jgi:hypothetical protein
MSTSFPTRFLVAGLTLLSLGNAWALTPADGTPELSLYIPGSQANDPAFGFLVNNATVANALCLDNALPGALSGTSANTDTTTHIYFHTAGLATAAVNDNYSAVYCYTDSSKIPGLTGGTGASHKTRLWISRRRLGASFVGLDAVANGTLLTFLKDPTSAVCSANNGSYSSGGATYQWNYSCTTATAGITATAATSDVTPDVFHGSDNVTPGKADIDATTIANQFAIAGHIIGTPVTLKLRNALQYAGIQSGSLPSSCTVGDESAACVPSLSKEQLVSIFSGTIADWSSFTVKVAGVAKSLAQVVADGVTAGVAGLSNPLDTTVHICRRENGAGQQVALLANILQSPCLGSSAPALVQPGVAFSDVQYATSLGAVDKCLGDFNDGSNGWFGTTNPAPFPNPPATSVPHGNQWAISIQTTERNATRSANYRFIKINGALPTGEQVYLGHYPLVGEYGISWKTNSSANVNAALNALVTYSGLPGTVAGRNGTLSNHSWGQAGYIALSANGHTPPATWASSNPVTPYIKSTPFGAPDACAIPVVNPNFGTVELR